MLHYWGTISFFSSASPCLDVSSAKQKVSNPRRPWCQYSALYPVCSRVLRRRFVSSRGLLIGGHGAI